MSLHGSPEFNPNAKGGNGASRLSLTLALDLANSSEKRSRIASLSDLALHDLTSPRTDDREKGVLQTPTPTQFLFPKNVTEEQEAYAHGFERALEEIYKEKGAPLALAAQSEDPATTDGMGDRCGSGKDVANVSSDSESTATPRSSQASASMASRGGQFSQCVSQASFGNASNIVTSNSVSTNFNFTTNLAASQSSSTFSQVNPSVCRSQQFVADVKSTYTEPVSYSSSAAREEPMGPMPFRSSIMGGLVTAAGATVNWPANTSSCSKVPSLNAAVSQIQAGNIPQIRAQSEMIPRFPVQVGTVPPNYSNVLHSHARTIPGGSTQAGTIPLMHSHAGTVQSQSGNMVLMHTQPGAVPPARSQTENMVPAYSQTGTSLPIQSQAEFHGFNAHRTYVPQFDSLSHPGSGIYHGIGPNMATNLSWSGLSSTGAEPDQPWSSMKCEVQPVGMVNMDEQERMKLERKRAKNRVAAQRCQMRKLERIARLEDKADKLREQNSKLFQTVDALRAHIAQLKRQITAHANKGCRLLLPDVSTAVTSVVGSSL